MEDQKKTSLGLREEIIDKNENDELPETIGVPMDLVRNNKTNQLWPPQGSKQVYAKEAVNYVLAESDDDRRDTIPDINLRHMEDMVTNYTIRDIRQETFDRGMETVYMPEGLDNSLSEMIFDPNNMVRLFLKICDGERLYNNRVLIRNVLNTLNTRIGQETEIEISNEKFSLEYFKVIKSNPRMLLEHIYKLIKSRKYPDIRHSKLLHEKLNEFLLEKRPISNPEAKVSEIDYVEKKLDTIFKNLVETKKDFFEISNVQSLAEILKLHFDTVCEYEFEIEGFEGLVAFKVGHDLLKSQYVILVLSDTCSDINSNAHNLFDGISLEDEPGFRTLKPAIIPYKDYLKTNNGYKKTYGTGVFPVKKGNVLSVARIWSWMGKKQ